MDYLIVILWIIGFLLVLFLIDKFVIRKWKHLNSDDLLVSLKDVSHIDLPHPSAQRGIVMYIDNITAIQAILSIQILKYFNCQLPIQVAYLNGYLDPEYINYLSKINVKCFDLVTRCNVPIPVLRNSGRAFALIFAPFKQVLLVDPSVVFLVNPDYLFQFQEFGQTGAVFWKDKLIETKISNKTNDWLNSVIPFTKGDNLILAKMGTSFQSASVVLVDKTLQKDMLKKLWVLAENIETIDSYLDGEKELYWLAAELSKTPYIFGNHYPGVIGEQRAGEICGELLYYDLQGNLLFFTNLVDTNNKIKTFTHYAHWTASTQWKKVLNMISSLSCLKSEEIYQLDPNTLGLLNEYKKILHDIRSNF